MHPFQPDQPPIPGLKPSLRVLLREGWRLVGKSRSLVSDGGEKTSLKGVLPARAKITPTAPLLATTDRESLNEDERYLTRHVQVILTNEADLAECADALRELEGVEEVTVPPRIGLP